MIVNFGIVTPTLDRRTLLSRHLRRVRKQTYRQWQLLVVHDGPSATMREVVEDFQRADPRISYLETPALGNDSGVTPRLEGICHFIARQPFPDYVVFWDDDNAYATDALERIAASLERAEWPDLLLVGVRYGTEMIPPANVPIQSLKVGQIDTASLVFRPLLARDAYASVRQHLTVAREEVLRFNDFLAYRYVDRLDPPRIIARDAGIFVCQHDGLRMGPYIRTALRIPPLSIARLIGLGR